MRHHPFERPSQVGSTDLAWRDNLDGAVAADRPAAAPDPRPRRWVHTLGLWCYVAASLMLAAAILFPIVALAIFFLWFKILIGAALGSNSESVGLGGGASPFVQALDITGHDPLTGTVLMIALMGYVLATAIGGTAALFLGVEVLLILGALILFLIGRRLRRGRPRTGRPTSRSLPVNGSVQMRQ